MIIKKLVMVTALLSFSVITFASGDQFLESAPSYFGGFYAGAGVGMNYASGDVQNTVHNVENILYTVHWVSEFSGIYKLDKKPNGFGFASEAFAGYGWVKKNSLYFGGELFIRCLPGDINANQTSTVNGVSVTTEVTMKSLFTFGAAFRGGFLITPKILFYGLVGEDTADLNVDVEHTGGVKYHSINQRRDNIINQYSYNELMFGVMPGIGVEYMVTNNLGIRVQDTYSFYFGKATGSENFKHSGVLRDSDHKPMHREAASNTEVKLAQNVALVEAVWHF